MDIKIIQKNNLRVLYKLICLGGEEGSLQGLFKTYQHQMSIFVSSWTWNTQQVVAGYFFLHKFDYSCPWNRKAPSSSSSTIISFISKHYLHSVKVEANIGHIFMKINYPPHYIYLLIRRKETYISGPSRITR